MMIAFYTGAVKYLPAFEFVIGCVKVFLHEDTNPNYHYWFMC